MYEENKGQSGSKKPESKQPELSDVWLELLGGKKASDVLPSTQENEMPVLSTDPWQELTQARGIEEMDLRRVDLQVSDQEVEQMLQIMEEQDEPGSGGSGSAKQRRQK
jgi:hypothetical protein